MGTKIADYAQAHDLFSNPETEILIAVSHPNQDHTNKIPTLFEGNAVQSICLGGLYDEYTGPIGGFLDQSDQAGVPIHHGWPPNFNIRGHPIEGLQCGAANTYILAVNKEGPRKAQNMVLLLDNGGFPGILAGAAQQETEEPASQPYGALMEDNTVLIASHHGADTHGSNHDGWIAAIKPQIVVFSAGNRYGHPRQEAVERYQVAQTSNVALHHIRCGESNTEYSEHLPTQKPVYVTKENGAIVIRTNGQNWQVECSLEVGFY
ncbi:MAG TPA: hypothetical protein DD706_24430 [Nitrospiraceae bacterium]|nr:hypothetical protein [Nitrospiraceae bacterium]